MAMESIPDSFFCPITQEVMSDPVVDPEGNTYERAAIVTWLQTHSTSPITRSPLSVADLAPNRALRDAIAEKLKSMPSPPPKKQQKPAAGAAPLDVALDVQLSSAVSRAQEPETYDVLVSVAPAAGVRRSPVDIVCVVDISGSMGTEASLKNEQGQKEGHGLNLLDIVKHAVRTVMAALQAGDRLAIISYSDTAAVVVPLQFMTEPAKGVASQRLEALRPDMSTNIWDGLFQGLELLRQESTAGRISSILLLTDGLPNISPPRGEVAMLQRYKDTTKLSCSIHTFGFGYDINSVLLQELALEGLGSFSFIPDSSFVGTIFVHSVSNLLATACRDLRVSLEPMEGAELVQGSVGGSHQVQYTSWGANANLCSLLLGQNRDLVLRVRSRSPSSPLLRVTVKYEPFNCAETLEKVMTVMCTEGTEGSQKELYIQKIRCQFVECVATAMKHALKGEWDSAQQNLRQTIAAAKGEASVQQEKRVVDLLRDMEGQTTEAISKPEYFKKWGRHYLPSLARAHQLQQCNNFKDPGVQHYGGELFRKERDVIDDLFVKLPPPKPSIIKSSPSASSSGGSRGSAPATKPLSSMARYHSRGNPCFAGECPVLMASGEFLPVAALRKGHTVQCPDGSSAQVLCVVKTRCLQGRTDIVRLGSLLRITPYHPVFVQGKWFFPCDLAPAHQEDCDAVYSFVLSRGHQMVIGGITCITLGHDRTEEKVAHPYFGSSAVIEDLRSLGSAWANGWVELEGNPMLKSEQTGLICGLDRRCLVPCA